MNNYPKRSTVRGSSPAVDKIVGGTNLGYMVHKLQKVIDDLVAWGNSVGLSFNEKKTIAIHFTRTKQISAKDEQQSNRILQELYISGTKNRL